MESASCARQIVSEFNPFLKCHVKNQFLKNRYLQEYGTITATLLGKLLYLYKGISQELTMLSQKVLQQFCLPAQEEETAAQILLFLFRLGAKLIVLDVYCIATSEWTKMGVIAFCPIGQKILGLIQSRNISGMSWPWICPSNDWDSFYVCLAKMLFFNLLTRQENHFLLVLSFTLLFFNRKTLTTSFYKIVLINVLIYLGKEENRVLSGHLA